MVLAQSIPNNHFLYQSRKLLYDAGKDWQSLTVFGPIRFKSNPGRELKTLNSSNYILIDFATNRILAEKGSEERMEPASLTKIMTFWPQNNLSRCIMSFSYMAFGFCFHLNGLLNRGVYI